MTGPALRQWDSHHAIHEAAWLEAEELTRNLENCIARRELHQAADMARILLEHWETRTLRHAQSEEEEWYREIVAENPAMEAEVIALCRDHELMRTLVSQVTELLRTEEAMDAILRRFEALLLLVSLHSRDEETRLLVRRQGDKSDDRREGGAQ